MALIQLSYAIRDYPTSLTLVHSAPLQNALLILTQEREQDSVQSPLHCPVFMLPLELMRVVHASATTTIYSWNCEHYTNFDLPDGLWFLHLSNPDVVQSAVLQRETPPRPPVPPGVPAFHRFQRYAYAGKTCAVNEQLYVHGFQGLLMSEPPMKVTWYLFNTIISQHACWYQIHEHCYWVPVFSCIATWPPPETLGITGRLTFLLTFETHRKLVILEHYGVKQVLTPSGNFNRVERSYFDIWVPLTRDTAAQIPSVPCGETCFYCSPRLTWSHAKEMIQCMQSLRMRNDKNVICVNDERLLVKIVLMQRRWETALTFYVGYVLGLKYTRLPLELADMVLEFAAELYIAPIS